MDKNSAQLKRTLSDFGVDLQIITVLKGLRIWRFDCSVSDSEQLKIVSDLEKEIQLAMRSDSVLIEVPDESGNNVSISVAIKDEETFIDWKGDAERKRFEVSLGQDMNRDEYVVDFSKETSMLVVGVTGSGKSLFLEVIVNSLMLKNDSAHLKFVFIDTKRVQLTHYGSLPNALFPVEIYPKKAVDRLHWIREEIDRRKGLFKEADVKSIEEYKDHLHNAGGEQLSHIVVVVEDFSDVMAVDPTTVESIVLEIIKEGTSVGVSILFSTSRPSSKVCTPALCNAVSNKLVGVTASKDDSITVIGREGAEKLLGVGDVLVLSSDTKKLTRIQGYYLSEEKIQRNLSLATIKNTKPSSGGVKSWWDKYFSLWYFTPLVLLFLLPIIYSQNKPTDINSNDFDLGIDLEENGSLPKLPKLPSHNLPSLNTDAGNRYESRSGNSAPYSYNYDVSGYGDSGDVYGNIDIQDKYGEGYIYNEDGEEVWVQVEWVDYGVLEAYDENDNFYELEVD